MKQRELERMIARSSVIATAAGFESSQKPKFSSERVDDASGRMRRWRLGCKFATVDDRLPVKRLRGFRSCVAACGWLGFVPRFLIDGQHDAAIHSFPRPMSIAVVVRKIITGLRRDTLAFPCETLSGVFAAVDAIVGSWPSLCRSF